MKSTRLCATLILSVMTAAGVRLAAQNSSPTPTVTAPVSAAGPLIQVDVPVFDYGKAAVGQKVPHTYIVTNTGTEPLLITNVHPSCGCTTAGTWTHEIAPGQTGKIPVQFDSSRYTGGGQITKTIDVYSNAKNEGRKTLQLKVTLWKPINVLPSTAMFNIPPDATSPMSTTVKIINQTPNAVTMSDAASANPLFTPVLKEITPGKEYELVITANPPFKVGNSPGTITVKTSLSNMPTLNVTAIANVAPTVQVYPSQLMVNTQPGRWTTNVVTLHGNTTNVLTVSNPKASDSRIQVSVEPAGPKGMFRLFVAFPPDFHIQPGQHVAVTVETSDAHTPLITIPVQEYARPRTASWPSPNSPQVAGHPTPGQVIGHP